MSFNPLFIGACLRTSPFRLRPHRPVEFQSPLHRGTSSDGAGQAWLAPMFSVSIPSSSGHVFGQQAGAECLAACGRFQSPLHRGTSSDLKKEDGRVGVRGVSIPSSSGHVIGQ